jgi:hypothetical protein
MKSNSRIHAGPALLVVLVAAASCDRRPGTDDSVANETRTTGATQSKPSVEQVKDSPASFYGKRVTLSGEVESPTEGGRAFTLEGNKWIFDHDIRVLSRSPVKMGGATLKEDDDVVVTGTVRRFVVAEVERELGWDLSPQLEIELREKPVLVAEEVRRVEPSATWTEKNPEGEIVGLMFLVAAPSPDALTGQAIRLDKTKVQSKTGKGMWVGASHAEQTFVLAGEGVDASKINVGDLVDVRGTLKKTPPVDQALKDWGAAPTMRGVIRGEPLYIEASQVKAKMDAAKEKPGKR